MIQNIGEQLTFFLYSYEERTSIMYIRLKFWQAIRSESKVNLTTHLTYLLGIQEQLQLTSQSSSSLTWRHPLLRSGMWPLNFTYVISVFIFYVNVFSFFQKIKTLWNNHWVWIMWHSRVDKYMIKSYFTQISRYVLRY